MKDMLVNDQIRYDTITLITEDGKKFGDISRTDALRMAGDQFLDLIEVSSPNGNRLAICKLADYGKIRYKQSKKDRHQAKAVCQKEMRIGLHIADHDLNTKNRKVEKFLKGGYRVKYVIQLKGRDRRFVNEACSKLKNSVEEFLELANIGEIKSGDGSVTVMLSPKVAIK